MPILLGDCPAPKLPPVTWPLGYYLFKKTKKTTRPLFKKFKKPKVTFPENWVNPIITTSTTACSSKSSTDKTTSFSDKWNSRTSSKPKDFN